MINQMLALDLASQTGFCCGHPSTDVPEFGEIKFAGGDDIGRFATSFEDWLSEMISSRGVSVVVFEAPILPGKTQLKTLIKLYGLAFETERICKRLNVRCRQGYASSVRAAIAGNGRASKEDIVSLCRRYGWRVQSHDAADACLLWAYAVTKLAPEHATRFALGPLGARAA